MIKNNNDYLTIAYNTSTELKKEKVISDNNLYTKKFQKFIIPKAKFNGSYTYTIPLECEVDSILNLCVKANFNKNVDVEIVLNNTWLYVVNTNVIDINNDYIVSNDNEIVINYTCDEDIEIDNFEIKINGNFKMVTNKNKFVFKSIGNEICLAKQTNTELVYSRYSSLDEFKQNFYYDIAEVKYSNLLDYSYTILNNSKNSNVYLYVNADGQLILTDENKELVITSDAVECACVIPIINDNYDLQVSYVKGNQLYFAFVNSNFEVAYTTTFNHGIMEKIVEIGGVDNLTYLNIKVLYIITNNNNIYLTFSRGGKASTDLSEVCKVAKGIRCSLFTSSNFLYLFAYYNNCLQLIKFELNDITNWITASKKGNYKFYNCDNGFVYNNNIYIISGNNVTNVNLDE